MTFCSVPAPELASAAANVCQWPRGHVVKWEIWDKPDEFSDREYLDVIKMAWSAWEAATGVRLVRVETSANLILTTRHIDGQHGILAEAQLPCGNVSSVSQLKMWLDIGEDWVSAVNPPGMFMDAYRVLVHEFGHLLGIGHIETGPAIMNPSISDLRSLTDLDIAQGVARYGDPSETPGGPGGENACEALLANCFSNAEARKTAIKGWELIKRAMANGGTNAQ